GVIGRKTGRFPNARKGTDPLPACERAGPPGAKSREKIEIFHHPLSARSELGRRHGLSGQVEIKDASDVQSIPRGKQAEGATDPWVHIQNLVLPVAMVAAKAYVQNPLVADSAHEVGRNLDHGFVGDANAQAGYAGLGREPADLASGH